MRRGNIKKFGQVKNKRKAFVRSLITALIAHGKIKTTAARARVLSAQIQKLLTEAKKQNLSARKPLLAQLSEPMVKKLMSLAESFSARSGGFVKITGLGRRKSDGAPMTLVEWIK